MHTPLLVGNTYTGTNKNTWAQTKCPLYIFLYTCIPQLLLPLVSELARSSLSDKKVTVVAHTEPEVPVSKCVCTFMQNSPHFLFLTFTHTQHAPFATATSSSWLDSSQTVRSSQRRGDGISCGNPHGRETMSSSSAAIKFRSNLKRKLPSPSAVPTFLFFLSCTIFK